MHRLHEVMILILYGFFSIIKFDVLPLCRCHRSKLWWHTLQSGLVKGLMCDAFSSFPWRSLMRLRIKASPYT